MKKTISVNIKGYNFLIEEDAYETLSNYLERLKQNLGHQNGAAEILEDIEIRIAELFSKVLSDKKQVVELEDVSQILANLGDPSDFIEQDEAFEKETSEPNWKEDRRMYRDPKNGVIAGVCKGISNYLNIDVVIVRALFILVFMIAGFGVAFYILLWIIIPKAKSSIDRLKMRGRPITVETVKSEVEEAGERVNKASKKFAKTFAESEAYDRLRSIGNLITKAFGIFLLFIGFSSLITFLVFIIGGFQMIPAQTENGFLSINEFTSIILSNPSDSQWLWIAFYLMSGSWILFFMITGFNLLFQLKNRWTKMSIISLIFLGAIGIAISIYVGARTGRDLAIEGEIENQVLTSSANQLQIIQETTHQLEPHVVSDGKFGVISIEGDQITNHGIHFEFIPSKDSLFHIHQYFSAHGLSHRKAIDKASRIQHQMNLTGDSLRVSSKYQFPVNDKMRDQEVYITIEIPNQKSIILDKQIIDFNPENELKNKVISQKRHGILYSNGKFKMK